jgi:hypothetical protein
LSWPLPPRGRIAWNLTFSNPDIPIDTPTKGRKKWEIHNKDEIQDLNDSLESVFPDSSDGIAGMPGKSIDALTLNDTEKEGYEEEDGFPEQTAEEKKMGEEQRWLSKKQE